jgi:hypothetical protein
MTTQTELDTLKGEFSVKWQKIKLKEMEVESKLIEFNDKKEEQEGEIAQLKK